MVKAVVVLKPKTIKLEFVASLLNIKESGEKTGWRGIGIMCLSVVAWLLTDWFP